MKKAILFLLLVVYWPVSIACGEEQHIGKVKGHNGIVSIQRGAKMIPVRPNMELMLKDVIVTGSDGSVGVMLEDNTLLSMGPMSRLALDKFEFAPAKNKYALRLRMVQGTFVYLSGLLGKLAPVSVELDTPVGKISMLRESNFMAKFPGEEGMK